MSKYGRSKSGGVYFCTHKFGVQIRTWFVLKHMFGFEHQREVKEVKQKKLDPGLSQ